MCLCPLCNFVLRERLARHILLKAGFIKAPGFWLKATVRIVGNVCVIELIGLR